MLIPSKFNGYVKNVRLYNVGGGVGEAMLISAAIGGGTAAVTGGDPLKGALLGAATGGLGAGAGALAGAAPVAEVAAGAAGAGAAGAGAGAAGAGAAGAGAAGAGAGTGAGLASIAPATSVASTPIGYAVPASATSNAVAVVPTASTAVPAAADMSSFQTSMQNPTGWIEKNKMSAFGAGLAGATGASKLNSIPGQEEYKGPLNRFNRFDPDKYKAARYAKGGIADLGSYSDGGRMLRGPGDGMSDSIPASIEGKRPARLADGEFVVPADVVSHLGNGSTNAGSKSLYAMMDKVRAARTGTKAQGKQINPAKYMSRLA